MVRNNKETLVVHVPNSWRRIIEACLRNRSLYAKVLPGARLRCLLNSIFSSGPLKVFFTTSYHIIDLSSQGPFMNEVEYMWVRTPLRKWDVLF